MEGHLVEEKFLKVTEYLDSFVNYEKTVNYAYRKNLKLKRVKHLLKSLDVTCKDFKVIHIAGTKGKGSVATFVAYILASSGFKVGLYTSPHFKSFRERIKIVLSQASQVISNLISKKDVIRLVEEFKPHLEKLRFTKEFGKLTFFEVYTALAFKYFLDNRLDFIVLEVGLGGRLDATNVVKSLSSIITHIGYDHTQKLGTRLKEIAYEKSGIIKKKTPVVSSLQRKEVLKVIINKCRKMHSSLFILGRDFDFNNVRYKKNYTLFDFRFKDFILKNLKVNLKGKHQVENASLAITTLYILKDSKVLANSLNFRRGLQESFIEGRFEIARTNPLIILDIAHNVSSFLALAQSLRIYFPRKKIILIFSASKDKDVRGMLRCIRYDRIIITSFNNPRAHSPWDIKRICCLKNPLLAKDIKEALEIAYKYYNRRYLILISGSLFLISEAKTLLN